MPVQAQRRGGIKTPEGFEAPFVALPLAFNAVVDGTTMSLSGRMKAGTDLLSLASQVGGGALRDLPIEPAPAGTCP